MKLDIRINYSKLDRIHTYTVGYIHALSDAADAIKKVQKELRRQESKTVSSLYDLGERILKKYEDMISALEDIKNSVKDYNLSMYDIIAPKNEELDMRIDFLDLAANVATIKLRAVQFYDIPADLDGNSLSVVQDIPGKIAVAAGVVVMAIIDEATNQKNGYFKTLLDIKTNKMPACATAIEVESCRLDKILKAALEFQAKDIYFSGKATIMYGKYTNVIEFYTDWSVDRVQTMLAQLEGAWDAVKDFFVGIGAIIITYIPAIPASVEYLLKDHPSKWSIDTIDKANAMTDTLKGYLNDPFSLVENISQQASDTLDKKGTAYAAAYVVTDLIGIDFAIGKISKYAKTLAKSDEIVEGVSKVDDAAEGTSNINKGVRQPVSVSANEIRFSQSSINGADEIISSMKANGWKGDPIDVIKMSDGKLTTIDNTRVVAAREAGIDAQAIIHDANELLPENLIDRFTTKKGVPKTWGEAIELRIGKQKSSFRNNNPFGADTMERIGK
ncbi:hypothetical protein [Anaerosacchariphilus polymeriproducens]|uniref:hypothetical protein n=1 Tax=Anaerosacchariphilus polymeriproducens TaxID=1812858 RepID=UPI00195F3AB1|nr:hypothetical protein [Anaerosacchariphilus polymeriproducens]